ncbi:MAG TPA: NHLP leader peptide family RiPP precursor [Candidatus Nanopelagicales bacterium]|nr:NHLP leader peptide family RiPP precursor [Candidatus Nanopelagicales bacterium]
MTTNNRYESLVHRAVEDLDFRERLVANPASAIQEATGVSVPDDVEIVVVENTAQRFHVVLPSTELNSAEMDPSAGNSLNFDPEFHQLRPPNANWLLS